MLRSRAPSSLAAAKKKEVEAKASSTVAVVSSAKTVPECRDCYVRLERIQPETSEKRSLSHWPKETCRADAASQITKECFIPLQRIDELWREKPDRKKPKRSKESTKKAKKSELEENLSKSEAVEAEQRENAPSVSSLPKEQEKRKEAGFKSSPLSGGGLWWALSCAPTRRDVVASAAKFDLFEFRHVNAFCSKPDDVPPQEIAVGAQKITYSWSGDLPPFISDADLTVDFDELSIGLEDLVAEPIDVVLECLRKAPSRKEVLGWMQENGIPEKQTGRRDARQPSPPAKCHREVDFDQDIGDLLQQHVVLRVRRNSEDSMGSELSCSQSSQAEERKGTGPISHSNEEKPLSLAPSGEVVASGDPDKCKRRSILIGTDSDRKPISKRRRVSWQDGLAVDDNAENGGESIAALQQQVDEIVETSVIVHAKGKSAKPCRRGRSVKSPVSLNAGATTVASPIQGPSVSDTHGFKIADDVLKDVKALNEHRSLSVLSMELFVATRQKLLPDPEFDAVCAIFAVITNDVPDSSPRPQKKEVIFVVEPSEETGVGSGLRSFLTFSGVDRDSLVYVQSEEELMHAFVKSVEEWDPDFLVGYEVQMESWGYLIERAATLNLNLAPMLSRIPSGQRDSKMKAEEDAYGAAHTSELHIAGRIVLNAWRLLRSELVFYSYSFENMLFHVMHQRTPKYDHASLTSWWNSPTHLYRWRVIEYWLIRVHGTLNILEKLDLIGRTCELARVFGILFFEVISRGSQFRVESLMLRLTKRKNFLAVSPNVEQLARMKAPEYIALVMEPQSRFYVDPVIVLDFQSLYPSIIIAYNYCFSTCLGRVQNLGGRDPFEFGCTRLKISPERLEKLEESVNFAPCGAAFVKPAIRKGVLPQMLEEILDTRFMVKDSMKLHKTDKALQRVLHARQLGLKLIANVTYGYTSANFSGRMPSVEVADSVVSKGRETLVRAIKTIESTAKWRAKVVYGDTDSVFVLLRGRSKEEAFKIGAEIAEAVTQENPKPVKLKFEKVYMGCILQTKKRYVGYMYEHIDQKEPTYDAKGIETVRRDGCPAVAKILEKSLRVLFETKDVSKVKAFVQRQFIKIVKGRASIQDLTFAREFRGLEGYRPTAVVPALEITRRLLRADRRNVPRTGQRVPYVIVYGQPGQTLIQSVKTVEEVVEAGLRLNAHYYIVKAIGPALNRCFTLIGADVLDWFGELPRCYRPRLQLGGADVQQQDALGEDQGEHALLRRYVASQHCAACDALCVETALCSDCKNQPHTSALKLSRKMRMWDKYLADMNRICRSCAGPAYEACSSHDCPVFYQRTTAILDAKQVEVIRQLLDKL